MNPPIPLSAFLPQSVTATNCHVRALRRDSPKRGECLRLFVIGIAFGQNEKPAVSLSPQEYESEPRCVFRLPALYFKSLQGCRHALCQVGRALQPLAFDDFPLQVEENYISWGVGAGVEVVMVSDHGGSFAKFKS